MIISRIFRPDSNSFKKMNDLAGKLNFMKLHPIQVVGVWIMFFGGWVTKAGLENENLFWDWSNWLMGITLSVVIAIIHLILVNKKKLDFTDSLIDLSAIAKVLIYGIFLYLIGFGLNIFQGFIKGLPYFLGMASLLMVYAIPVSSKDENGIFTFEFSEGKINRSKIVVALILMILALAISLYFNDPVSSTSSAVIIPFLLVASVGHGIRHLIRARFYGLLIPALFIASRFPWLLIPLIIVFYFTRFYNYYRQQIVYPSFGVDYNLVRLNKRNQK